MSHERMTKRFRPEYQNTKQKTGPWLSVLKYQISEPMIDYDLASGATACIMGPTVWPAAKWKTDILLSRAPVMFTV